MSVKAIEGSTPSPSSTGVNKRKAEKPQSEVEKKAKKVALWTFNEEQVLIEGINKITSRRISFQQLILKDPSVAALGRNPKQLAEKWDTQLNPDVIRRIQDNHKPILVDLYKEHGKKWRDISGEFACMELPDKPERKYYSANAIKNFVNSSGFNQKWSQTREVIEEVSLERKGALQNKPIQEMESESRSSSAIPDQNQTHLSSGELEWDSLALLEDDWGYLTGLPQRD